jgi:hypothetical protein
MKAEDWCLEVVSWDQNRVEIQVAELELCSFTAPRIFHPEHIQKILQFPSQGFIRGRACQML